jgi:hypothetical protein
MHGAWIERSQREPSIDVLQYGVLVWFCYAQTDQQQTKYSRLYVKVFQILCCSITLYKQVRCGGLGDDVARCGGLGDVAARRGEAEAASAGMRNPV